jgi:hypothetical protein
VAEAAEPVKRGEPPLDFVDNRRRLQPTGSRYRFLLICACRHGGAMATQPSLRIGDRERNATTAELREHFAHGRLTLEEFNQRLDAVFVAKTQRDLSRITSDLPHVRTSGAPLPSSRPSFPGAWAPVGGPLRGRGWVWWLSMLWVVIGAGGAIYAIVTFTHPGYGQGDVLRPMFQWPGEPMLIIVVGITAQVVWMLLPVPLLVAGFVRLRGWRPRNWLRVAGWAGSWVAGLALMIQAGEWANAGAWEGGSRAVLSVGEMAICAAWLALGGAMTWILSGPQTRADSSVSDSNVATH